MIYGLLGLYTSLLLLSSLPAVQRQSANWIAEVLSDILDTRCEIGSVDFGFLNRVIINDLRLEDQRGEQMLSVARVSASIDYLSLLNGEIEIPTAQLFSADARLYCDSVGAQPNFQFVIDAFKSDKKEEGKTPHIRINQLLVRHANVSYDILSEPYPAAVFVGEGSQSRFSSSHVHVQDLGLNLSLKHFSEDSLNVSIRRLGFTESQTGFTLSGLDFSFEANRQLAILGGLNLRSGHSALSLDTVRVDYADYESDGRVNMQSTVLRSTIYPYDLRAFVPSLHYAISPVQLYARAEARGHAFVLQALEISAFDNNISLAADGEVQMQKAGKPQDAVLNVSSLRATAAGLQSLRSEYGLPEKLISQLQKLGDIEIRTLAHYVPEAVNVEGRVMTDVGSLSYEASVDSARQYSVSVQSDSLQLRRFFDNPQLGCLVLNASVEGVDRQVTGGMVDAKLTSASAQAVAKVDYSNRAGNHSAVAKVEASGVNLAAFGVKGVSDDERLDVVLDANLHGSTIDNALGELNIRNLQILSPEDSIHLDRLSLVASGAGVNRHYNLSSDFFDLNINGRVLLSQVPAVVKSLLANHLPSLIKGKNSPVSNADFAYNLSITDHPLLHHYVSGVPVISSPVTSHGNVSSERRMMNLFLNAPHIVTDGTDYTNVSLRFHNTAQGITVDLSGLSAGEKSTSDIVLSARATNNQVDAHADVRMVGSNTVDLHLNTTAEFADSLGKMLACIKVRESSLTINDTLWQVMPGEARIHEGMIDVNGVGIASGDRFLTVQGRASKNAEDSIVAELNNIDVKYVLDIVRFRTVRFSGEASGRAIVKGVMTSPDLLAHLNVKGLRFQDGLMGDADITGRWDNEKKSILLDAHIVDFYKMATDLKGTMEDRMGITDVHGFVSPANKELELAISTENTHLDFLNGVVNGFMNKVDGSVSGKLSVVGPFREVNLIGEVEATANLSLRATKIPYHLERQRISFRERLFSFDGITMTDQYGREGLLNGRLTHRNLANFAYSFNVGFNELLLYDEKQFNSDRFYATVFGTGNISVEGRDGHPMTINANVTPTKGSVFAYDAASPDALTNSSFIEYRDKQKVDIDEVVEEKYNSDLYINFNLNLDNNCEIRLRMDNKPDGYISTFGHANLLARFYNKSGLQLFGSYNIDQGNYRLYLQDLIYKDLAMQPGSKVEFNGAPFDANLHLICHHTINSVPISDLTTSKGVSQSNKVRVVCILDITGNLDNMHFKFDLSLPNVSDEMRQLVRSVISTEEEMNTQMIYLLGFSRFYPTGFASAESQGGTGTSAVNSLVSSTISGQVNKFLSTVIGNNSNWSVGTGIATGERGWKDLDVEGTLSGRLFDDRLLINGNFGYRDNVMTNKGTFIGDFEVKWRVKKNGKLFLKAYNQTNDRYFTKATLNTQGIGISFQHDFESWMKIFSRQKKIEVEK